MFQSTLESPVEVLSTGARSSARPRSRVRQRRIYGTQLDDVATPLFDALCSSIGLPSDDGQRSSRPHRRRHHFSTDQLTVERIARVARTGRHVAVLADGELVVTSSPTLELLERTLVGLHAWSVQRQA